MGTLTRTYRLRYTYSKLRKGGFIFYSDSQLDAIKRAHLKFQQTKDDEAVAIMALAYTTSQPTSQPQILASGQVCSLVVTYIVDLDRHQNQFFVALKLFYDGPTPSEVFNDFLAIPSIEKNVTTRSFSDLILSQQSLVSPSSLRYV